MEKKENMQQLDSVLWIRNDLFRIRIQLQIFRVPDSDSCHLRIFGYYFKIHLEFTLHSFKNKNLPTFCHFLFHTKVPNSQPKIWK